MAQGPWSGAGGGLLFTPPPPGVQGGWGWDSFLLACSLSTLVASSPLEVRTGRGGTRDLSLVLTRGMEVLSPSAGANHHHQVLVHLVGCFLVGGYQRGGTSHYVLQCPLTHGEFIYPSYVACSVLRQSRILGDWLTPRTQVGPGSSSAWTPLSLFLLTDKGVPDFPPSLDERQA